MYCIGRDFWYDVEVAGRPSDTRFTSGARSSIGRASDS